MIRNFSTGSTAASSFAAALVLLAATAGGADETFPVVHNEPITVRVLSGKSGQPLAHAHLTLTAGYSQRDLQLAMWHEDALTDDQGKARLPSELANLPYLEIKVAKKHLCMAGPSTAAFSVERIRRDGLSAANRCGTVTVENAPGVFTVFVKGKNAKAKGGKVKRATQPPVLPAPIVKPASAAAPAAEPVDGRLVSLGLPSPGSLR